MKAELRMGVAAMDTSFQVKVIELPEFDVAWHYHPHFELTYMVRSTGIRYIGDSMDPFDRGDLVLVGTNLPHSWKTIASQEPVKCVVIHWDEDLLSNWNGKPEFESIRQMLNHAERGIRFTNDLALTLEPLFLKMPLQQPFDRLLTFLEILHKLAVSPDQAPIAGHGFDSTLSPKSSDRVSIINNYIKDHIHHTVSLEEISDHLAMSKEMFCRFFKKTFGRTFTQYVNNYKVNLAGKLLIQSDLSVSEVGYRTGFNNLTFFHRQFKKYKKVSPKVYQQMFKSIPAS